MLDYDSYEMNNEYWVPVPAIVVDDKDNVLDELARLESTGTPHRVMQYHKDLLIVEKKVVFEN